MSASPTKAIDKLAVQTAQVEVLRGRAVLVVLILLAGDILSIILAFGLASLFRAALVPIMGGIIRWNTFFPMLQLNLVSILVVYTLTGLYPGFGKTAVEEMRQIIGSLTLGYGVLVLAVYLIKAGEDFARFIFVISWVLAIAFNLTIRFTIRNRASLFSWWGTPVIVAGAGEAVCDATKRLLRARRLGLRPVLILDESAGASPLQVMNVPVVCSPQDVEVLIARQPIQYAVFAEMPGEDLSRSSERLSWLSRHFPTVLVVLADSPFGSLWVKTVDLEGRLALQTQYHLLNRTATFTKRVFDLALGTLLAILMAPLLLVLALLIKLDSPGPVFYHQERYGLNGLKIRYLKFRTMVVDADARLKTLMQSDAGLRDEYQIHHKLANDPRCTRAGKILRKYSLDELPQIWHVLRGEMSLVGPRAYLLSERAEMGGHSNIIFKIRPGITGWWQVMGRHATTFQQRMELDEYYISNWSLWLDIYVLAKTGWVLISGKGA